MELYLKIFGIVFVTWLAALGFAALLAKGHTRR